MNEPIVLADDRGRIVFVMPHDRYVLVGTTDTDFTGDPASVRTENGDIEYLIAVLAEGLPKIKLTSADVATSFAGLRALVIREDEKSPSAVPREETIFESASGMLTVAGGKLTTHREIAQKVVDRVMREMGRSVGVCPTLTTPFPGARPLGRRRRLGWRRDDLDAQYSGRIGGNSQGALRNPQQPIVARIAARAAGAGRAASRRIVPRLERRSSTRFATRWRIRSATFWCGARRCLAVASRSGSRGAGGRAHHGGGTRMGSRAREAEVASFSMSSRAGASSREH